MAKNYTLGSMPKSLDELIAGDHPVWRLEFRGWKTDTINWTDKSTGAARSMGKGTIAAETNDGLQISLDQSADTVKELDTPPFKKGDKIFVALSQLRTERGVMSARVESYMLASDLGKTSAPAAADQKKAA